LGAIWRQRKPGNVITNPNPNGADSDPDGDPITVVAVNGSAVVPGQIILLARGALTFRTDGSFGDLPGANINRC
jgi:hypothetical protein